MKKSYFLLAVAAMFFSQAQNAMAQSQASTSIEYKDGGGMLSFTRVSDNGAYLTGAETQYTGIIWDIRADEEIILAPPGAGTGMDDTYAWDITDNGVAVGSYWDIPATWDINKSEWKDAKLPEDYINGEIRSVSPDGKYMAGYVVQKGKTGVPCMWISGEPQLLENVLKDDVGDTPQFVHADRVSADGSIILGSARSGYGGYALGVVWRAPEYKAELFFLDKIRNEEWLAYTTTEISPDGKWLGGMALVPDPEAGESGMCFSYPYRYNFDTKQIDVIDGVLIEGGMGDGGPSAIDNNGTIYCSGPSEGGGNPWARTSYVCTVDNPTPLRLQEYVAEFGYQTMDDELPFSGILSGVSSDGLTLVGCGADVTDDESQTFLYKGYIIKLNGGSPLNINNVDASANFSCYTDGNTLNLIGTPSTIEIINMAGSTVLNSTVNASSVSLAGIAAGVYAVKLSDGKNIKVEKIVINH